LIFTALPQDAGPQQHCSTSQYDPAPATAANFLVAHPPIPSARILRRMRPIELRTVQDLLDREHTLGLYCPVCDRWADAPLAKRAARGRDNTLFARFRFRCVVCGATDRMQLRPVSLLC
jgi:hypothetical protein